MYLHLSSSLKYPREEARTSCKNCHCNFTWRGAVEWLLRDLQLHRLQHHLLRLALVLLLCPSLSDLRAPTLCWAQRIHRQTGFGSSLVGQADRRTGYGESDAWERGRRAELIWLDFGSQEDFLWRRCSLSCSERWHLSLLLWRLCEFPVGLPCLFPGPLARPFPSELWSHSFCSPTYPLSGPPFPFNRWSPNPSACMWDRASPPPQPGSTCISPKCFCSLLELFLCLGSWPMCTPYLMGTCLFVSTRLKSHLFYETSLNSIFPFRITDLLL